MLHITGVEITQAIQYFGSTYLVCGAPAHPSQCADNSIPLVAGKPTAVRIYFEGATRGAPITGFGVKLLPDGSPSAMAFPASMDRLDVPSPPAREDVRHSLNLTIPAQSAAGAWKLSVSIFEKLVVGVGQVAMRVVDVQFVERALVPVRLVRMHYRGRGLDIAPPTIAEFWQMMDFAQRTWPSPLPGLCIVRESVEVFDGAFTTQVDSNDPAEIGTTGTIWDILERLKASEGLSPEVIYFGFYPNAAGANGGVGGGQIMIAPNVLPGLTAHELGHAQGLPHAPTPAFGPTYAGADQSFPRYGSLPWGSVGEVGFDPRVNIACSRTDFDFMGYDRPIWIAPHHYLKLFAAVGAPKPGLCSSLPNPFEVFRPPPQRFFTCYFVEGLLGGDFIRKLCGPKIDLLPPKPGELTWPVRATLLDAQGVTIFEDTFPLVTLSEAHDALRQHGFWIAVPELLDAKRLVVTHGDHVVEDSELSLRSVAFQAKAWVIEGPIPTVRVEWVLSAEDAGAPVFVRASSDHERSWTAFNVPVGAKQLDIDPASLPPGDGCVVEVLAGERLRTTSWKSLRLPVQVGRDAIIVLSPGDAPRVAYGEPIELVATTTYGTGHGQIVWNSDRDGDLGMGGYQLARLSPGRHVLTVRRGSCGRRTRAGVVRVIHPSGSRT